MALSEADAADALWDARDVAKYLNVSRSWVYQKAESGELPHTKVGALLRFEPEKIRAYRRGEKSQTVAPVLVLGRSR